MIAQLPVTATTDPEPVDELLHQFKDMVAEARRLSADINVATVLPRISDAENVTERIDALNAGITPKENVCWVTPPEEIWCYTYCHAGQDAGSSQHARCARIPESTNRERHPAEWHGGSCRTSSPWTDYTIWRSTSQPFDAATSPGQHRNAFKTEWTQLCLSIRQ